MKSLGSEKIRWLDLSNEYKILHDNLNKTIFMSSAQLIYFGPFTQAYRERILQNWLP